MDKIIDLAEIYDQHLSLGDNVYQASHPVKFKAPNGVVLQVAFDDNITDEQIQKGERKVEVRAYVKKKDLTRGWDVMMAINAQSYDADKVAIAHHSTLNKILKAVGLKYGGIKSEELPKYFSDHPSDTIFLGSVEDVNRFAQANWTANQIVPGIEGLDSHINSPLMAYVIGFIIELPGSKICSSQDHLHRGHNILNAYVGETGHVKEHLVNLENAFQDLK